MEQTTLFPGGPDGRDDDRRESQNLLVEAWLAQFPRDYRPPEDEVKKQARIAGRLADSQSSLHDLRRAVRALPHTYPFSTGQPYDVATIERWLGRLLVVGSRLDAGWDPALATAARVRGALDA